VPLWLVSTKDSISPSRMEGSSTMTTTFPASPTASGSSSVANRYSCPKPRPKTRSCESGPGSEHHDLVRVRLRIHSAAARHSRQPSHTPDGSACAARHDRGHGRRSSRAEAHLRRRVKPRSPPRKAESGRSGAPVRTSGLKRHPCGRGRRTTTPMGALDSDVHSIYS
jgi:hypothetical protein